MTTKMVAGARVLSLFLITLVGAGNASVYAEVYAESALDSVSSNDTVPGHVDFEAIGLPPASIEVDLTHGVFGDLFGLGDAVLGGVTSALTDSGDSSKATEATLFAAKQIGELRSVLPLAKDVIREVRVRAYEGRQDFSVMSGKIQKQLDASNWQQIAKVRDGEKAAIVSLLRENGAIQGVFVVATEDEKTIVANVVCDISPDKAEKLSEALTKVGLDAGLRKELENMVKDLKN